MNEIYFNGITSANLRQMANVESDDIKRGCKSPSSFCSIPLLAIKSQIVLFILLSCIFLGHLLSKFQKQQQHYTKLMLQLFNIVMCVNIQVVQNEDRKPIKFHRRT